MKKVIFIVVLFFAVGVFAQSASSDAHDSRPVLHDPPSAPQDNAQQQGASPDKGNGAGDAGDESKTQGLEDVPGHRESAPPPGDNDSSSNSTKLSLAPPPGEPDFRTGSGDVDVRGGVTETKPWNPHKSDKNVEVGDFYFRRQNYEAAESRYREALYWMDNNAIASFRLAEVLEQLGRNQEAVKYYRQYLSILPQGSESKSARNQIQKLANKPDQPTKAAQQQLKLPEEVR
jgi:tetratricopeptide (TPR) repeat protein